MDFLTYVVGRALHHSVRVHKIEHVVLLDRGRHRVKVRPSQAVLALLHAHALLKVTELVQISI